MSEFREEIRPGDFPVQRTAFSYTFKTCLPEGYL